MMRRLATILIAGLTLAGCGEPAAVVLHGLRAATAPAQVPNDERLVDLAFAALLDRDHSAAQIYLDAARRANPRNPYMLLNLGALYQNTGRSAAARAMYRMLLVLNPRERVVRSNDPSHIGKLVVDLARENLALLEGEQPLEGGAAFASARPPAEVTAEAVAARFTILGRLKEEGLLSDEAYEARRRANLGSLLPLTAGPPVPALRRPAPPAEDVVARLGDLEAYYREGLIEEKVYLAERAVVLDALMPAAPEAASADEPPDPERHLARLRALRTAGLIAEEEFAAERQALAALAPRPAPPDADHPPGPPEPAGDGSASAEAGGADEAVGDGEEEAMRHGDEEAVGRGDEEAVAGGDDEAVPPPPMALKAGVQLASYRTPERAKLGWRELAAAHADLLSGLDPHLERVDLGPSLGVFYRLQAGPLADEAAARELCRRLHERQVDCAPAFF